MSGSGGRYPVRCQPTQPRGDPFRPSSTSRRRRRRRRFWTNGSTHATPTELDITYCAALKAQDRKTTDLSGLMFDWQKNGGLGNRRKECGHFSTRPLTPPASSGERLCNGRASVRPSVRLSVPLIGKQQRRTGGLLLSAGADGKYWSIHRTKWRHRVYGHDKIAMLWV